MTSRRPSRPRHGALESKARVLSETRFAASPITRKWGIKKQPVRRRFGAAGLWPASRRDADGPRVAGDGHVVSEPFPSYGTRRPESSRPRGRRLGRRGVAQDLPQGLDDVHQIEAIVLCGDAQNGCASLITRALMYQCRAAGVTTSTILDQRASSSSFNPTWPSMMADRPSGIRP